jgi:hypothetical protein
MAMMVGDVVARFRADTAPLDKAIGGLSGKLDKLSKTRTMVSLTFDDKKLRASFLRIDKNVQNIASNIQMLGAIAKVTVTRAATMIGTNTTRTAYRMISQVRSARKSVKKEVQQGVGEVNKTLTEQIASSMSVAINTFSIGASLMIATMPRVTQTVGASAVSMSTDITNVGALAQQQANVGALASMKAAAVAETAANKAADAQTAASLRAIASAKRAQAAASVATEAALNTTLGRLKMMAAAGASAIGTIISTTVDTLAPLFTMVGDGLGFIAARLYDITSYVTTTFLGNLADAAHEAAEGLGAAFATLINPFGVFDSWLGSIAHKASTLEEMLVRGLTGLSLLTFSLRGVSMITGFIIGRINAFASKRPNSALGRAVELIDALFLGFMNIVSPLAFIVNRVTIVISMITLATSTLAMLAGQMLTVGGVLTSLVTIIGVFRPLIMNLYGMFQLRAAQLSAALGVGKAQTVLFFKGLRESFDLVTRFVRDVGGAVKGVKFDKMASLVWSTIKGVRDSLVHIATLVTKIVLGSVNIADNTLTAAEQTIRSSAELTDIQNKTTALQRTSDRLVRDGHQALTLSQQMGYWFTKATDALSKAPLAFIRNTLPNSLNLIWKMTSRMWTRLMVNFRDSGTSIFRFLYESTPFIRKGFSRIGRVFRTGWAFVSQPSEKFRETYDKIWDAPRERSLVKRFDKIVKSIDKSSQAMQKLDDHHRRLMIAVDKQSMEKAFDDSTRSLANTRREYTNFVKSLAQQRRVARTVLADPAATAEQKKQAREQIKAIEERFQRAEAAYKSLTQAKTGEQLSAGFDALNREIKEMTDSLQRGTEVALAQTKAVQQGLTAERDVLKQQMKDRAAKAKLLRQEKELHEKNAQAALKAIDKTLPKNVAGAQVSQAISGYKEVVQSSGVWFRNLNDANARETARKNLLTLQKQQRAKLDLIVATEKQMEHATVHQRKALNNKIATLEQEATNLVEQEFDARHKMLIAATKINVNNNRKKQIQNEWALEKKTRLASIKSLAQARSSVALSEEKKANADLAALRAEATEKQKQIRLAKAEEARLQALKIEQQANIDILKEIKTGFDQVQTSHKGHYTQLAQIQEEANKAELERQSKHHAALLSRQRSALEATVTLASDMINRQGRDAKFGGSKLRELAAGRNAAIQRDATAGAGVGGERDQTWLGQDKYRASLDEFVIKTATSSTKAREAVTRNAQETSAIVQAEVRAMARAMGELSNLFGKLGTGPSGRSVYIEQAEGLVGGTTDDVLQWLTRSKTQIERFLAMSATEVSKAMAKFRRELMPFEDAQLIGMTRWFEQFKTLTSKSLGDLGREFANKAKTETEPHLKQAYNKLAEESRKGLVGVFSVGALAPGKEVTPKSVEALVNSMVPQNMDQSLRARLNEEVYQGLQGLNKTLTVAQGVDPKLLGNLIGERLVEQVDARLREQNLSRSGLLAGKQYAAGLLSAGPDVAEAAQNYLFHMLAKYHQSPPKSGPLAGGTLLKAGRLAGEEFIEGFASTSGRLKEVIHTLLEGMLRNFHRSPAAEGPLAGGTLERGGEMAVSEYAAGIEKSVPLVDQAAVKVQGSIAKVVDSTFVASFLGPKAQKFFAHFGKNIMAAWDATVGAAIRYMQNNFGVKMMALGGVITASLGSLAGALTIPLIGLGVAILPVLPIIAINYKKIINLIRENWNQILDVTVEGIEAVSTALLVKLPAAIANAAPKVRHAVSGAFNWAASRLEASGHIFDRFLAIGVRISGAIVGGLAGLGTYIAGRVTQAAGFAAKKAIGFLPGLFLKGVGLDKKSRDFRKKVREETKKQREDRKIQQKVDEKLGKDEQQQRIRTLRLQLVKETNEKRKALKKASADLKKARSKAGRRQFDANPEGTAKYKEHLANLKQTKEQAAIELQVALGLRNKHWRTFKTSGSSSVQANR